MIEAIAETIATPPIKAIVEVVEALTSEIGFKEELGEGEGVTEGLGEGEGEGVTEGLGEGEGEGRSSA